MTEERMPACLIEEFHREGVYLLVSLHERLFLFQFTDLHA